MDAVGRTPVAHGWLLRVLGWWNGIARRPEQDIVKMSMACSVSGAVERAVGRKPTTWASAALTVACRLVPEWGEKLRNMQEIPRLQAAQMAAQLWRAEVGPGLPVSPPGRQAPPPAACPVRSRVESEGYKLHTWHHWFRADFEKGQVFAYHLNRPAHISAVARLYFGAHDLEIERGRQNNVPRDRRLCPRCRQEVEDECHVLLECVAFAGQRAAPTCQEAFAFCGQARPCWQNMREVTQAGNNRARWIALAEYMVRTEAQRREHKRRMRQQQRVRS